MFPIQALSVSDGIVPNAIPRLAPGAFMERPHVTANAIPRLFVLQPRTVTTVTPGGSHR
jgi:hypothetical protein